MWKELGRERLGRVVVVDVGLSLVDCLVDVDGWFLVENWFPSKRRFERFKTCFNENNKIKSMQLPYFL